MTSEQIQMMVETPAFRAFAFIIALVLLLLALSYSTESLMQ
jgi:hypothetical protein